MIMATSIGGAIQEAIDELLTKAWVTAAEWDQTFSEDKPCNYVRKRLNVFHKVSADRGHSYSGKDIYINKDDFTWKWHYGGPAVEPAPAPFRDLLDTKLSTIKTAWALDHIEIQTVDESVPSATILAVKGTTGNNADTYTIKAWKTGVGTIGYKIISKTTIG